MAGAELSSTNHIKRSRLPSSGREKRLNARTLLDAGARNPRIRVDVAWHNEPSLLLRKSLRNRDLVVNRRVASERRAALFGSDPQLRAATVREAMAAIEKKRGQGSGQEWWAFEGFTHVDACFDTAECLLIIEGKGTEAVSPSTRWFAKRNQLWRNVEVVGELAGERPFAVILAVERAAAGKAALQDAERSRDDSYPHLSMEQKRELDRHFLGFALWSEIVSAFNLPPSVLLET